MADFIKQYLSTFKSFLALAMIIGFFALLFNFKAFNDLNDNLIEPFVLAIGGLISMVSMIVGYYFGSSTGSADKTKILDRIVNGNSNSIDS